MDKCKGLNLKEGMQILLDGNIYDVLMSPNYYGHSYLCILVHDHIKDVERYLSISPNKSYDIITD